MKISVLTLVTRQALFLYFFALNMTNKNNLYYYIPQEVDLAKLEAAGCTAVFIPETLYHQSSSVGPSDNSMVVGATEEIDYDAHCTWVNVDYLSQGLCAGTRPHHFRGVCTVVTKLFNIIEPDAAFFGKKDYQQWMILKRMARDLDFAIEIVGCPIARESDGLAMSSRNALLTQENRAAASCIYKAITKAKQDALSDTVTSSATLRAQIIGEISNGGGIVDYVEVVHAETLQPVEDAGNQPTVIAVAAKFGLPRLLDNVDF